MNRDVTVRLNVLGIDLNENQVDPLLLNEGNSFTRQRDWLTSFFQLDNSPELTRGALIRYAQADAKMARISVGTNQQDIYDRLIGTLVSAKRCYSNAEYLACIELCALHGEMLANYLCITDRVKLEQSFNSLSESNQNLIAANKSSGIYFSDRLNQTLRLRWLIEAKIITADDRRILLKVHGLRIKYFHHWSPKRGDEQEDAIKALSQISFVTARYLEILGVEPKSYNTANLDRIKNYMRIVSDENHTFVISKVRKFYKFFCKLWHYFIKTPNR